MAKDLSRVVPKPASGKPQPKDPNAGTWRDPSQYDPTYLSQVGGQALVDVYEGLSQLPGTMYNVLRGFMERQRQKSPEELRGTADPYDTATYDAAMAAIEGAAREPVKTAKSAASALAEYGKKAVSGPAGMTQFLAENLTPLPRTTRGPGKMGVVKPKGGDFLKRMEAIDKLRYPTPAPGFTFDPTVKAVNTWLETKLDKYIRNEMATPEDPIRKLAEEGILHVNPEQINFDLSRYGFGYGSGLSQQLMAKSDTAKIWEGATDNNMGHNLVGDLVGMQSSGNPAVNRFFEQNPWIAEVAKKDPDRKLYAVSEDAGRNLGFDHLRDELLNSIIPESGFPQQLRLTNEQLGRMSVPDAVRHVSKINKWREKQKAEANFALANNAATVPFKDYPDQKYGWFQLKAKSADDVSAREADEIGEDVVVRESQKALKDALKYEGDLMGHCIGGYGYCDDVISGRSQIYSLRDKKTGAPHVTIEVAPVEGAQKDQYYMNLLRSQPENVQDEVVSSAVALHDANPGSKYGVMLSQVMEKRFGAAPSNILQIKGKGNRKPKDEYIPFVQDFVRSGKWDSVEEIENTGLVDLMRYRPRFTAQYDRNDPAAVAAAEAHNTSQQARTELHRKGLRFVTPQELEAQIAMLKGQTK